MKLKSERRLKLESQILGVMNEMEESLNYLRGDLTIYSRDSVNVRGFMDMYFEFRELEYKLDGICDGFVPPTGYFTDHVEYGCQPSATLVS